MLLGKPTLSNYLPSIIYLRFPSFLILRNITRKMSTNDDESSDLVLFFLNN